MEHQLAGTKVVARDLRMADLMAKWMVHRWAELMGTHLVAWKAGKMASLWVAMRGFQWAENWVVLWVPQKAGKLAVLMESQRVVYWAVQKDSR